MKFVKLTTLDNNNIYINLHKVCSFLRVESANRTYLNYAASNNSDDLLCDMVRETPEQIMELISNER